ncbi:MAG: aldehyde dehydrogenase family protein [Xanthomonadales bacterium]|nr:aldehyde dehydrogenase family protein [Xanthomonadales bacterium]
MLTSNYPQYIGSRAEMPNAGLDVLDKFSGEVAARVPLASSQDVERAIAAAHAAAPALAAFKPWQRQAVLEHCVRRFRERADELALALCIEAGKPIKDARGEVGRLIDTFRIAAEESVRIGGETLNLEISARGSGYRGFTRRAPIGPCSFITPFNFPLNLVAHKIAPAIAAGCPFVLKPAPRTPIGALILGEILAETDLPVGAFSILCCSNEAAAPLIEDERFTLLSFTGGAIGWDFKARAGRKKVTLELGGDAACIVDAEPGVALEHVVDRLVFGAYYQSGQSCISVQRILVHDSLYATLREKLITRVEQLKMGNPRDEDTFIGPLIDHAAAERIEAWIREAKDGGARVLAGGERRGNLHAATLLQNVPAECRLAREEAFGPVAYLEPFSDFDAAIARVNTSRYGLQAGVFTRDIQRALRAWERLEVGGVVVGDVPSFRMDNMPYGGIKASGLGREGVRWAIEDMSETRLLVLKDWQG